ncbi:hypothetical protein ADEAN_000354000 [Angomonas deanei]|uniref:Uncharacterized protein n=1 Tax=Angomonas deanei TaxID=59799 RepID=A0A7G2C964_9TRYP|nr:hypothetical protein ADEAN_000354000 [Angomonas deanei]
MSLADVRSALENLGRCAPCVVGSSVRASRSNSVNTGTSTPDEENRIPLATRCFSTYLLTVGKEELTLLHTVTSASTGQEGVPSLDSAMEDVMRCWGEERQTPAGVAVVLTDGFHSAWVGAASVEQILLSHTTNGEQTGCSFWVKKTVVSWESFFKVAVEHFSDGLFGVEEGVVTKLNDASLSSLQLTCAPLFTRVDLSVVTTLERRSTFFSWFQQRLSRQMQRQTEQEKSLLQKITALQQQLENAHNQTKLSIGAEKRSRSVSSPQGGSAPGRELHGAVRPASLVNPQQRKDGGNRFGMRLQK